MGDLLEDIKNDDSDFLAKSSKKGLSGRKKSDLGKGPFREFPAPAKKIIATVPSTQPAAETAAPPVQDTPPAIPVSFRSDSGLSAKNFVPVKKQTGLKTGLKESVSEDADEAVQLKVNPRQLRHNPRKVLRYLYQLASTSGDRTTPKFNATDAAEDIDLRYESFRTALKVLRHHNMIERVSYRSGPSGWCQFRIFKEVYRELYELYSNNEMDDVEDNNSGLNSGLSAPCSSSNKIVTTTTTEQADLVESIAHIDLSFWNIGRRSLVKYIGEGATCETVRELEEFLHRARAAVEDMKGRGETVRSPAGFLMHCLREGHVGVPAGYKSLEEIRLEEANREKRERLERMKAAKEEQYRVDFALFKEEFDVEERRRLLEEIRTEEKKKHPTFASKETLERTIQARFNEAMARLFVDHYPAEERMHLESSGVLRSS